MWVRGVILGVSNAPSTRGGTQALPSFGVPFYLCTDPLTQNYQIWRGNTHGKGVCFQVWSTTPPPQGGGVSALPNFGEFLSIYAHTLYHRTTKFEVVTHVGVYLAYPVSCISYRISWLGVSHASHPKTAEFQRSSIFGVLLYLCPIHPLTQILWRIPS